MREGGYALLQPASPETIVSYAGEIGHNLGVVVNAVLATPEKTIGRTILLVTDYKTFPEAVAAFEKVTGQSAIYCELTDDDYERLWGPLFGRESDIRIR